MSNHTYSSMFYHVVWSTKKKIPYIEKKFRSQLYNFIGQNVVMRGCHPMAINGTEDHIHLLLQMFPNYNISSFIGSLKANSSKFMKEKFNEKFCWQGGFAIFTVDIKLLPKIKNYILKQEDHHKVTSFEDEFKRLLIRNNIEYGNYSQIKMMRKHYTKL